MSELGTGLRRLDFFPDWRGGNPYLSMLFADLGRIGACARPTGPVLEHLASAAREQDPGVLNLHWTAPILDGADQQEAVRRVARLGTLLAAFKAAGGRLVWTVHNVLPHDAAYPDLEAQVCQVVSEHADLVHVLSEETLRAVAPLYTLDLARVVTIPHSSYVGCYPQDMSPAHARRRLGLGERDLVLTAPGRIRPYKGLDRLLEVFARPPLDGPDVRLLVAGAQGRDPRVRGLVERLRATPRVVCRPHRVPPRLIQVWLAGADLAVLPYHQVLNSGSFHLAETFGLPVVAPRTGSLVSREGQPHVRLFDPDDADDLRDTVAGAFAELVVDRAGAERARRSALAAAAANAPDLMARRFAAAVAPLLLSTRPTEQEEEPANPPSVSGIPPAMPRWDQRVG